LGLDSQDDNTTIEEEDLIVPNLQTKSNENI